MRKLILLEHTSLDGFMAGPNGEMDWIRFDEELADYVGKATEESDTALYGRVTYDMMEAYWPTAAESPNASKHDIEHANWVNKALKVVFSRSVKSSNWANTMFVNDHIVEKVQALKKEPGKSLLLIGSPSIAHIMINASLVDEYWINVNPVVLGTGIPLFKDVRQKMELDLVSAKTFGFGVLALQYRVKRDEK